MSSGELFEAARAVIPGGVNSPVRACKSVGGAPLFISRGEGPYIYDADGKEYIDLVGSWGPLILGHRHPQVVAAIENALANGTSFGAPSALETEFAQLIAQAVPSIDKVRAVSSGTEATMSALRLARGFTGRDLIVKIDGGYHGHADFLLVAAGSGAATLGIPGSLGVPSGTAKDTLLAPFNDAQAMEDLFAKHGDKIAAVIVEPIAGNMGVVPPQPGYLEALREITQKHGTVLIFDEVMTGFRVAYGGAQSLYGVTPDMTCLGKVVGGGLPAAAFGGRAEIMDCLAPDGDVYQAGTLSGNPLAMAAGIATLNILKDSDSYTQLETLGASLEQGLEKAAQSASVSAVVNRVGSMMTCFFTKTPVVDYSTAKQSDTQQFGHYFRAMREQGIFLAPSQFEALFLSTVHTPEHIEKIIASAKQALP